MAIMQDKLIYKDTYRTTLSTTVTSCQPEGEHYVLTLEESIFYPEGGGQPADTGTIGGVQVLDVHEKEGVVLHKVAQPLSVGDSVEMRIDWEKRFSHMQHHSGEHIVSGLIYRHFGYDNVGFHMGEANVTMDFNGELTPQDLEKIEFLANQMVQRNVPTRVEYPTPEALAVMEFRSKKELKGEVRIVRVADADVCACCGTHVAFSGEIGCIRLLGGQKYKGGTRVTMVCGMRALTDYRQKDTVLERIAQRLSTKPENCFALVEKLLEQVAQQKQLIGSLREESFKQIAQGIVDNRRYHIIWNEEFSPNELRALATIVSERIDGACVALSGTDAEGYQYAIASSHINLREKAKEINVGLSGRGGGTPALIQGSFQATKEQIVRYFEALN